MDKDQLQQQFQELQILHRIATQLNAAVELKKTLQLVLEQTVELMDLQTAWIWLYEPGSNAVFLAASHNLPPAFTQHPERLSGWCYCIDKYLANYLDTAANISEISCTRLKDLQEGTYGLRYHATIPLYENNQKIGLLNVLSEVSGKLTDHQLALLHTIGSLLSVAVVRTRKFEKSKELGRLEERKRIVKNLKQSIKIPLEELAQNLHRLEATNTGQSNELSKTGEQLKDLILQNITELETSDASPNTESPFQYPGMSLTKRELEVLQLLKEGSTNKTIAGQLYISERTVKFHVSTILNKLNVSNRTEAVQTAVKLGIIRI